MPSKESLAAQDIWNMDETGFRIGIGKDHLVVTKRKRAHYFGLPENRESATAVEAISAGGRVIPPFLILSGEVHMARFYRQSELPDEAVLAVTATGFSNDRLALEWIKHFHQYTKDLAIGTHRLLILDGHGSHHTIEFIQFCDDNHITSYRQINKLAGRLEATIDEFEDISAPTRELLGRFIKGSLVNAAELLQTRQGLSRTKAAEHLNRMRRAGRNQRLQLGGVLTVAEGRKMALEKDLEAEERVVKAVAAAEARRRKALFRRYTAAAARARAWRTRSKVLGPLEIVDSEGRRCVRKE